MRQIPTSLLPSTMTWREPKGGTHMGGEWEDDSHVLAPVRFDRSSSQSIRDYDIAQPTKGTVYADSVNTEGEVPPVGALCSIDGGDEMLVRTVTPYHDFMGHLHHTELGVG